VTKYRSIFISDIHLGTISCKHKQLLEFLKTLETEPPDNLYLVGDIIDLWKLGKGYSWKPEHNTVVQKLLRLARKGVRIHYIIGNHDEYFRSLPKGFRFGDIELHWSMDYITANGRRFLIIHGDQYDTFLIQNTFIAKLGSFAYDWLVALNSCLSFIRRKFGFGYWSLSQYVKLRAKTATNVVDIFENTMCDAIRKDGYDGVICGHIHMPKIMERADGFKYINCGDWTESCTAVAETYDGKFVLLYI